MKEGGKQSNPNTEIILLFPSQNSPGLIFLPSALHRVWGERGFAASQGIRKGKVCSKSLSLHPREGSGKKSSESHAPRAALR